MINPLDAAKYFIVRAYEDRQDAEMTNMKVQKLLYYSQSLHLALYDEPLFRDEIQAWRYGPVCPSAYHYYSNYERKQLSIPSDGSFSKMSDEIKKLLEEVWNYFGIHHAYFLSDMTHLEFPWKNARGNLPREASSQEPLKLSDMQSLGKIKLSEIEITNPVYEPVMATVLDRILSSTDSDRIEKEEVRDWLESLLD
jgi:uncharacterized phage-associated protein